MPQNKRHSLVLSPSKFKTSPQGVRSTLSSASSSVRRADQTIKALNKEKVDEMDETMSLSSSHWDTDLEDEDYTLTKEKTPQQIYERACKNLGVTPVSRFSKEIGQEKVKISHRHLHELGAKAIAVVLKKCSTTTKVEVPSNEFSPKGGVYLGKILRKNNTLKELNLANNNINKEGIEAISEAISENNVISRLDLSGNGLMDKDARVLADAIENNGSLRHLNLSYNKFGELSGQYFGSALSYNNGILELNLSWNNIRRRGAQAIHKGMRYNDALQKLDLSWNGFDDYGTEELKDAIQRNTSLLELNISNNRLSDVGLTHIAQGLDGNTTLEVLDLSRNSGVRHSRGVVLMLDNITKKKCNLKTLKIIDVNLDYACAETIKQCLAENEGLNIEFGCKKKDTFATKRIEITPIDLLKEYIVKEKTHLSEVFRKLDINGQFRDSLTRDEFIDGMKRLKIMNEYQVDQLVEMLDSNVDGEIDYSEFTSL